MNGNFWGDCTRISGVIVQLYFCDIKVVKIAACSEDFLGEDDFDAVLAIFDCYGYGATASEAVKKIATDEIEYHKCFSFVCFKGAFSCLRQFLATESPLKMMKNAFYFTSKYSFRSQGI